MIADLQLAITMNISEIDVYRDSILVVNQIKGMYEAKEEHIKSYLTKAVELVKRFKLFQITQIPRTKNKEADALCKLASVVWNHLTKKVMVEMLDRKSIDVELVHMLEV